MTMKATPAARWTHEAGTTRETASPTRTPMPLVTTRAVAAPTNTATDKVNVFLDSLLVGSLAPTDVPSNYSSYGPGHNIRWGDNTGAGDATVHWNYVAFDNGVADVDIGKVNANNGDVDVHTAAPVS